MKVQSFEQMQAEYNSGSRGLEPNDLEERKTLLSKYPYSAIVEGEHSEFDNLRKWIKEHIGENRIESIYYGKTGYDYGFAEFFVPEKTDEELLKLAIPDIYTIYPHAYPSRLICKSDGYGIDIPYDVSNENALIYPIEK